MSSETGRKDGMDEVAKEIRIPNKVCGMLMGDSQRLTEIKFFQCFFPCSL